MTTVHTSIGRRSLLLGTAGLGAAALTGCAAKAGKEPATTGSAQGAATSAPGRLTIVGYDAEVPAEMIKAFEAANPGTKVTLVPYSWDKVTTMLAAGNAPDLVRGEGVNDTAFLQLKGLAQPLDDYIASSSVIKADDLMAINDVWRHDGTTQGKGSLLGLVKDYSSDLCVWVNKNIVKDVPSRTTPMTYDELLERAIANTTTSKGRTSVYGLDSYLGTKPHIGWMNAMVTSAGGSLFSDDLASVDMTTEPAVKFLKWNLDLMRAKATISSYNPSAQGPDALYLAGRMAMFMSGYWTQGMIKDAPAALRENSVMLPCPQLGTNRTSPVISGSGMWMPARSKNKDLAWKFMEFYFGQEPARSRAASGWGIPALKSLQSLIPEQSALQKATLATQRGEEKYFKVMNFTPYAKVDAINTALAKVCDAAVKANTDAATVGAECTRAINEILAKGKR